MVIERLARSSGRVQVFIQVGLLLRQAEAQPFGEYLMVAVAQSTVGLLRTQNPQQGVVTVSSTHFVA